MRIKVGVIGIGIMGKPMAKNLLKHGIEVFVFDLNENALIEIEGFGAKRTNVTAMAKEMDFIITMLPNMSSITEVFQNNLLKNSHKDLIIINMSSISPKEAVFLYNEGKKNNISILDAPVSGGEPKAIDGSLSIMVGGDLDTFQKSTIVFEALGKDIVYVGEAGAGVTVKLANQIIVNLNILAISEAIILASKAGIDIEKMYEAIRGGLAGSTVLDAKLPLILDRNFKAGGAIDINMKDLTNVMNTAHDLNLSLPATAQLLEVFHALKSDGKGMEDHSSIIKYYEKMSNTTVSRWKK